MTAEPGKNPADNGQAANGSAADGVKASAASEKTAADAKAADGGKVADGGKAFDGNKVSGNGQGLPKKASPTGTSRDDAKVNAPLPDPAEPTPLDGVKAVSTGAATSRSPVAADGSGGRGGLSGTASPAGRPTETDKATAAGAGAGAAPAGATTSSGMSAQPGTAGAGRPTMSPPDAHSSPGAQSAPPSAGSSGVSSVYGPSPVGGPSGPGGQTSPAGSAGTAGAPSRPGQAGSAKNPRKAHLQLARLEPWSVMKFSFVMSLVAFIVLLVAVVVLWVVLSGLGVFDAISSTVNDLTAEQGEADGALDAGSWFSFARVFGYTVLVGAVNVLLITALSTVGAVMYNTAADLVGGVEVTLKEAE